MSLVKGGTARIREAPGFCRDPDCADYFTEQAKAFWSFWRMGDSARTHLLDRRGLCAPVTWTEKTLGAGFVSIDRDAKQVNVDICLSTEQNEVGMSVFDDWNRIVKEAKDDVNREISLRLNLGAGTLRDFDFDAFKLGKRLGTADIELEVRPSAIQFTRDD
jgi:hypothetical protein